jgi:hypothetical protein
MKTCTKCKVEKPKTDFSIRSDRKCGLVSRCKKCIKITKDAWYAANAESEKQAAAKWYALNKPRIREWREENGQRINERHKNYNIQRRQTDPLFKLKYNLRNRIGQAITKSGYSKKSKTHEILGADFATVKSHLEATWLANYGTPYNGESCAIDHIVPCAWATTEEELVKLQHYTNLQYLTPEDNLKKSDLIGFEPTKRTK